MSNSKRSKEGYVLIDHRAANPVPDSVMTQHGLPTGAGKGLFEAPTYTCSHCQYVVVMNPQRTRERAYCRGCDSYICDACGVKRAQDFSCKTYKQVADEYLNAVEKNSGLILP